MDSAHRVAICDRRIEEGAVTSRWLRGLGTILGTAVVLSVGAPAASAFEAGAAKADITPPPYTAESDSAFTPVCGTTPAQVSQVWTGPRLFAFEKPYIDAHGLGR